MEPWGLLSLKLPFNYLQSWRTVFLCLIKKTIYKQVCLKQNHLMSQMARHITRSDAISTPMKAMFSVYSMVFIT